MSMLRTCPKCQCKSLESDPVRVWCVYVKGCGYSALHNSDEDAGQTHSDEPTDAEEREGMLKMVNATPPANQLEARYGLWISRLCEEVRRLEAERNRLRELGKQLALTLHGHNVGDLQRCADHDACIDWRIERDFGN